MGTNLNIWNLAYSVTNMCNLQCVHCYASSGKAYKNELDIRQIETRIIKPAADLGTKYVTFTGGEPFMRKDFLKIIEITRAHGIEVSIATNGVMLDDRTIAVLHDYHVARVQISIEGSTARLNDKIRGFGVFEKLTKQVIPQLLNANLFVAISFTPTSKNIFDIKGMADMCAKLGVPSLSIRRFSNTGRAVENTLSMAIDQGKIIANTIFNLKKEYAGVVNISSGDPTVMLSNPNIDNYVNGNYLSGCTAGITSLAIDSVGNIKPCTKANLFLGNVITDNLSLVWNTNEILLKLRDRKNLIGKCGGCKYKMLCGGCRVEALNKHDNIFEEDDWCWIN